MNESLSERYLRELGARGYVPDDAQRAVVARLEDLRRRLIEDDQTGLAARVKQLMRIRRSSDEHSRGVYLWGGVGRGKTWLMDLFYASLPIAGRRRTHFHHFMRDIHAQLRQLAGHSDPLEPLARALARDVRVLCLDELFVSDIADAMLLGGLFAALLEHGVLLVITSNVPPEDLYRDGLQRSRFLPAIALLRDRLEVIAMQDGIDYRLRQLQRQPIYLDSNAPDTAVQLEQLFEDLSPEQGEDGTRLEVCGRIVPARRRRADVVWFDFATLCEGPRSQNDYVELAHEFHSVLLSDVPRFDDPAQDNAARRFIALIDEFYDQGVKLVLSAAAEPQSLYRGERLQFEFQRTVSRLIEMQTQNYLGRPHRT
ncbi:MAG TPA: cell division protein ZapE [Steroidobacteraceae bacterium]|jgi:cell division protein ZapE|nr:cell division protein ZapE [Steroidobacteraceae bacterium]